MKGCFYTSIICSNNILTLNIYQDYIVHFGYLETSFFQMESMDAFIALENGCYLENECTIFQSIALNYKHLL